MSCVPRRLSSVTGDEKVMTLLQLPTPESELWREARDILHFVGICGAGKTTLTNRLGKRCADHGGRIVGTIDWDPHTPDHERASDRAFSRELDQLNSAANGADPAIHRRIVDHALTMIESWKNTDANLILVDRWYESYDHLPRDCLDEIEAAINASGFRMRHVLLAVEAGPNFAPPSPANDAQSIRQRLIHTRSNRPNAWWETGPDSLDTWVQEECAYQADYYEFCKGSRFNTLSLNTNEMHWTHYEKLIVSYLLNVRIAVGSGPSVEVPWAARATN